MSADDTNEQEMRRVMKDNARGSGAIVDGVLVHNNIKHDPPDTWQGMTGFHYESLHDDLEVCGCGWRKDKGIHYRVASVHRELAAK